MWVTEFSRSNPESQLHPSEGLEIEKSGRTGLRNPQHGILRLPWFALDGGIY